MLAYYYKDRIPESKKYEFDRYGVMHEKTEGLHFTKMIPPLSKHSLGAVAEWPLPDYKNLDIYRAAADHIKDIDGRNKASALALGAETIFEVSWPLYGMESSLS